MTASTHPFDQLTPDFLMSAIEAQGFLCDGRLLALNSYENRVYQVGIEDRSPLVAKFYRPGRWTFEQIKEEHDFCVELAAQQLPVITPLASASGERLLQYQGFYFALFPCQGGQAPELDNLDNLFTLGQMMGRIHRIGAQCPFRHRPTLTSQRFGHDSVNLILEQFIPEDLHSDYQSLTRELLQQVDQRLARAQQLGVKYLRTHGDCHSGNILWRDDTPHFVDFDDARMAPAVQDLWMFLSGERPRQQAQLSELLAGYQEYYEFNALELTLIEPLRTLRIIHYAAWLARRWQDPAFPKTFSWFNTPHYWEAHLLELRDQLAALQAPPLEMC